MKKNNIYLLETKDSLLIILYIQGLTKMWSANFRSIKNDFLIDPFNLSERFLLENESF